MKTYRVITEYIESDLLSELTVEEIKLLEMLQKYSVKALLIERKLWYNRDKEKFCSSISYYEPPD